MFKVHRSFIDKKMHIILEGRLDVESVQDFDDFVSTMPEVDYDVVVDMSQLEFSCTAGLRVLLRLRNHIRACKHNFEVINVSENMCEILEITGFDQELGIVQ